MCFAYIWNIYDTGAWNLRRQEEGMSLLAVELQMVVSWRVGTGNKRRSSEREANALYH